jgi:quinol monooxygenase YgiN
MAYVLVRHRVKDYTAWKVVFDSGAEMQRAGGVKSYQIFHPDDDPNDLLLLHEWDSLDNARAMFANPELKKAMDQAAVIGEPEVFFLEEYDRGTR